MCKASECVVQGGGGGGGGGPFSFRAAAIWLPPFLLFHCWRKSTHPQDRRRRTGRSFLPLLSFPPNRSPPELLSSSGARAGHPLTHRRGTGTEGKERLLLLSRGERAEAAAPLLPLVLFLAPSLPPTHPFALTLLARIYLLLFRLSSSSSNPIFSFGDGKGARGEGGD